MRRSHKRCSGSLTPITTKACPVCGREVGAVHGRYKPHGRPSAPPRPLHYHAVQLSTGQIVAKGLVSLRKCEQYIEWHNLTGAKIVRREACKKRWVVL